MNDKKFMKETTVHRDYGLGKPWLRKRRRLHDGPPFLRINRMILYERRALEEWLEKHKTT
jgi:hypothetical protein